jgi:hypothetical protein
MSPRLRFRSNVWNTTAVAANNTNDWWIESLPASGLTPSGVLKFGSSLNGAAETYPLTLTSAGNLQVPGVNRGGNIVSDAVVQAGATSTIFFIGRGTLGSPADGQLNLTNAAISSGVGLDFATDGVLKIRTRAQTGAGGIGFASVAVSGTAPTIASGGCTSPSVTWSNGTAAFRLSIGTTCATVKTITLTMPAAANGWVCDAVDLTTNASFKPEQSAAASATSVVITNYARTTGLAIDFVAGEVLLVKCIGG